MSTYKAVATLLSKLTKKLNMTMENDIQWEDIIEALARNRTLTRLINSSFAEKRKCCDGLMKDVSEAYNKYHVYLSLMVCLFGTVANILNIIVLTRKDMACYPFNRILAGLAVADMLNMIDYIPSAYIYNIILQKKQYFPYHLAVFILFNSNFAQVLHTISMCLTLTLAIWWYIVIKYPERSQLLCTNYRCTLAICISFVLPMFLCSPVYLLSSIQTSVVTENGQNYTLYHVYFSSFAQNNQKYYFFCLFTYSVINKCAPCVILTVIIYWLIRTLCEAARRKAVLRGYATCSTETAERRVVKTERRTERTTRMFLAVLLLFVTTEVPQAVLVLISAFRGTKFFINCYYMYGNIIDILALVNGAIHFILYCCMSRQFRQTFGQLFKPKILAKWPPVLHTKMQSTHV